MKGLANESGRYFSYPAVPEESVLARVRAGRTELLIGCVTSS